MFESQERSNNKQEIMLASRERTSENVVGCHVKGQERRNNKHRTKLWSKAKSVAAETSSEIILENPEPRSKNVVGCNVGKPRA